MDKEELIILKEAAEYLRIHERTLRRLLKQGKLPGFKIGRQWRFRRNDLEEYVAKKATHYGLDIAKPCFFHIDVLQKYFSDRKKYYIHDEAFFGKLGNRIDYYEKLGTTRYLSEEDKFAELPYRKLRDKESKMIVVLDEKQYENLPQEERRHWDNYICYPIFD